MSKTRRNHGSAFKAKVALEALKGEQTVAEIAAKLHPTLVNEWKRQLADGASSRKGRARPKRTARRWLASFTSKSASKKWNWIFWHASSVAEPGGEASDDRQTEQAPVVDPAMPAAGALSLYYQPAPDNTEDLVLMARIDRQFLETPYYGKIGCVASALSSTASGADASDGLARDLAEAQHQQAEPRAQDLSVLAARPYHRAAQPGVGDWALGQREAVNHGHPDAQGVFLLGGDHGLAQQESAELAAVQYDGRDLLCRGARGSLSSLRPTRDLQQRPGLPVYHSPACWRLPAFGSAWTANCMDNVFVERLWRSLKLSARLRHRFRGPPGQLDRGLQHHPSGT